MDSTYDRTYYYIVGKTHVQWERPDKAIDADLPTGWGRAMGSTYDRTYYDIVGKTNSQWERPSGPSSSSPSSSAATPEPDHLEQKADAIYAVMLGHINA